MLGESASSKKDGKFRCHRWRSPLNDRKNDRKETIGKSLRRCFCWRVSVTRKQGQEQKDDHGQAHGGRSVPSSRKRRGCGTAVAARQPALHRGGNRDSPAQIRACRRHVQGESSAD